MKNSTDDGFNQHYNVQAAVAQASLLIVAIARSNHPNDKREAEPTLDALSPKVGQPTAAALDNGYFSAANIQALEQRGIEPYIATGREPHHKSWQALFDEKSAPPPEDASPKVKMAYTCGAVLPQIANRDRPGHLPFAEVHRRTGDRHYQRSPGLSPVLVARLGGGGW
jgi:hypothetical protein